MWHVYLTGWFHELEEEQLVPPNEKPSEPDAFSHSESLEGVRQPAASHVAYPLAESSWNAVSGGGEGGGGEGGGGAGGSMGGCEGGSEGGG
jgi:hypothetical protein